MPKAAKTQKTVIMSPPTHFDIEYSINPWMNLDNKVDKQAALFQWQNLVDLYKNLGLKVKLIPASKGVPDLVFTTDHGVWIKDTFYLSNFRYPERQKEQNLAIPWYETQQIKVQHTPSYCFMEGGDVMHHEGTIFVGYGFRTSHEMQRIEAGKTQAETEEIKAKTVARLVDAQYKQQGAAAPAMQKIKWNEILNTQKLKMQDEAHLQKLIQMQEQMDLQLAAQKTAAKKGPVKK